MRRKGFSAIYFFLFILVPLLLGLLIGFKKLITKPVDQPTQEIETIYPGYSRPVSDDQQAEPIMKRPIKEIKSKEPERKTIIIKGVGDKERVPVDLPTQENPKNLSEDKKEESTIKLPRELEEIADKAKEQLDAFDDATERTVESILKSLNLEELDPDKATIRPSGDGVKLEVSIPVGE